jgi:hypothetical protein
VCTTRLAPVVVHVHHLAAWESLLRSLVSGIGGGQADAEQELWALLAVCQALRMTMTAAAEAAGADPDRASLAAALESAREQVITARGIEDSGSPDDIGRACCPPVACKRNRTPLRGPDSAGKER